jgi:hypothetical protein
MPTYPLGFHLNPLTNPWVEKLTQTHTLIEQKSTGFRVAGTIAISTPAPLKLPDVSVFLSPLLHTHMYRCTFSMPGPAQARKGPTRLNFGPA